MKITVANLLDLLSAKLLSGSPQTDILGFASLAEAIPGDLSFLSDGRYKAQLEQTKASAILVPHGTTEFPANIACIGVDQPSVAFEIVTEAFGLQPHLFTPSIHPSAVIEEGVTANLDLIRVGANAVIEAGAKIGNGSDIGAGCFVGRNTIIGENCVLHANSTVYHNCLIGNRVFLHSGSVVGADGFGYVFKDGAHRKVRQSGIVQIDDDVEVGAGTTIDRARFGRTWIGEGTKIDNQVQIGHNVRVGKHCILIAGAGIAGSSRLGDYVVLAAQCGVSGHVQIGSRCTIAARSVVTKDLPEGPAIYMGFPAAPAGEERRRMVLSRQLPDLSRRLKALEVGVSQTE